MQIVSWGNDLHEMIAFIFLGNKKSISKSAEFFFPRVLRVFFSVFFFLYVIYML